MFFRSLDMFLTSDLRAKQEEFLSLSEYCTANGAALAVEASLGLTFRVSGNSWETTCEKLAMGEMISCEMRWKNKQKNKTETTSFRATLTLRPRLVLRLVTHNRRKRRRQITPIEKYGSYSDICSQRLSRQGRCWDFHSFSNKSPLRRGKRALDQSQARLRGAKRGMAERERFLRKSICTLRGPQRRAARVAATNRPSRFRERKTRYARPPAR